VYVAVVPAPQAHGTDRPPWRCIITSESRPVPDLPSKQSWAYVDSWEDDSEVVREARARGIELGCVSVSRPVAGLLRLLASSLGAKAVVEVGTGTGVSGAALLAGMSASGVLTTIDIEAEHQRVARETFATLGYEHVRTRLIAGRALDVLWKLSDNSYDIIFIDGDTSEFRVMLDQAKRLLRIDGLAIFNGVLAQGRIADAAERDSETVAVRDVLASVKADDDWMPSLLTVGDGLLVASLRARS
jgi:predicted O-methyltransferase YrrM